MVKDSELKISLFVVALLTLVYVVYEMFSEADGGHPFGHTLGIIGAVLMLMTEFLYSARKRWSIFRFGRMRSWLSFHIFTGIVGPFLVLMHTALEFRGLAGISMGLTLLVVISGFVGRYIYTAVPRTLAGIEVDRRELENEMLKQREALNSWSLSKSARIRSLIAANAAAEINPQNLSPFDVLLGRTTEWFNRRRLHKAIRKIEAEENLKLRELEGLISQQQRMQRQISSLKSARRLMGSWHTIHIPLGITLFVSMAIHISAVFYYGGI